ncbi:hypothetical protein BH20ACT2_BH20ACT2_20440 [soil metagenome]
MLSLDVIKEALGDSLGSGDEAWSNRVGDAAAEVVFGLAASLPAAIAEGWWRRERRDRAIREFAGWVEVFCHCEPAAAEERMRVRAADARHPIHRDAVNPGVLDEGAAMAASATPLHVGARLIELNTTEGLDEAAAVAAVRAAINSPHRA